MNTIETTIHTPDKKMQGSIFGSYYSRFGSIIPLRGPRFVNDFAFIPSDEKDLVITVATYNNKYPENESQVRAEADENILACINFNPRQIESAIVSEIGDYIPNIKYLCSGVSSEISHNNELVKYVTHTEILYREKGFIYLGLIVKASEILFRFHTNIVGNFCMMNNQGYKSLTQYYSTVYSQYYRLRA